MSHAVTFQAVSRECRLPPDATWQLMTHGSVVIPGPCIAGGIAQLQAAYDTAVAAADVADVRISSSTRVTDFVNRSPEFDGLYVHPPLLAACCLVIGRPFKLSNTCARTLGPWAPAQKLHVDVKYEADGWPLVGYIWMIDPFTAENGATRFVSGSHRRHHGPEDCSSEEAIDSDEPTLACGPGRFAHRLQRFRVARPCRKSIGAATSICAGALRCAKCHCCNQLSFPHASGDGEQNSRCRTISPGSARCRLTNHRSGRVRNKVPSSNIGPRASPLSR